MQLSCPYCEERPDYISDFRTISAHGVFRRTSDSKYVKRYRCRLCLKTFSEATRDLCLHQKKRQKNKILLELLSSGVSQRRSARILRIDRKTVARKLEIFGAWAKEKLKFDNSFTRVTEMEFDDLETFEHSKCKPVSVTLAVESKTRRILGFEVAAMGAKGLLVKKAKRLYGFRADERSKKRKELFRELSHIVLEGALIKSDSNPYYLEDVKRYFPLARHLTFKGQRGAITGQGELKKIKFDPLFSLNHTCAMLRANICRLIRKTWCTTKNRARLEDHIAIYAIYHNEKLIA